MGNAEESRQEQRKKRKSGQLHGDRRHQRLKMNIQESTMTGQK